MVRRIVIATALALCAAPAVAERKPAPVEFHRGVAPPAAPEAPEPPAPPAIEYRRPQPRPAPAPAAPPIPNPDIWTPGAGAPLSTWALRPEEAAPFDPRHLPPFHEVAAGETLFALSVRYQVPLRALIEANRLDAPFALEPGQKLKLPPPRVHRVAAGETLLSVARDFSIDARSLALLNRLAKPYAVRAGDPLVLPALARAPTLDEPPAVKPQDAPQPAAPPRTKFAWPLIGPLLTRFGPQSGGKRSDGVDIAASAGAPVKAAADGRVVYAGDDIPGYGNLMLVQHAGGYVTAYAHCADFAVREGDTVRQGQKLALVAGDAKGAAHLHFQLRTRAGAPTDPLALLPPI